MPFIKLQFTPGVNRDQTNYSNEGGWWECDKIRFRSGYPEKIGGWTRATPNTFDGVCRQMNNWITSYTDNLLAVGTNTHLYIEAGGYFNNITPLREVDPTISSPDTDNCITVTQGLTTALITLPNPHGATTGNFVTISGVTGPIDTVPASAFDGNFQLTVVDAYSFSIDTGVEALNTATGGGTSIVIDFEIDVGNPITVGGYGWGTGVWGRSAWGLGSETPVNLPQRDWWMDNFDNDLVCNIRNGAGYWWVRGTTVDPSTALATRAVTLQSIASGDGYDPNAVPVAIMQLMVSQNDKHLIAFGAVPYGSTSASDFDPLLIRWADQDNPGQWTPTDTNTAGDIRVSRGSQIVRALPTRQEILVWTNSHLYTLQFLGTTDVFGLQEYADNISIISPRAVATAANITYWMGQDKFYAYTGRVETLPCTLRNHVFQNINVGQLDQVVCGTNEEWNEIWWFYPAGEADYNNAYVVYNHLEKIWYYGTMERSAWLDTPLRPYPQAANSSVTSTESTLTIGPGYLYNHENGVDDGDIAMTAYIQSNDFDLGDGEQFMLSRRVIPDIGFSGSTVESPEVTMEIRPRSFPGSGYQTNPADEQRVVQTAVNQYTDQVFIRARARQMAIKIQSENLGVQWQLGAPRIDVRQDGKR